MTLPQGSRCTAAADPAPFLHHTPRPELIFVRETDLCSLFFSQELCLLTPVLDIDRTVLAASGFLEYEPPVPPHLHKSML